MSNIQGNQQLTKSDRIRDRVDLTTTSQLGIGAGGSLDFANLNQIMEVAKVVATSQCAIPEHLQDNPGACLAVCIQASEWQMSPFSVANKSYVVNRRMAYESQLIAAVILMRAPIKDQFIEYTYSGEGPTRVCTCICTLTSGREVKHSSPEIGKIKVKNSPLWVNDPDQQLGYYTVRAMARRYFPHIILGVYTPEEMAEVTTTTREVGPPAPSVAITGATPVQETKTLPTAETVKPRTDLVDGNDHGLPRNMGSEPEPGYAADVGLVPTSAGQDPEAARLDAVNRVNALLAATSMPMSSFKAKCVELGITSSSTMLNKMTLEQLENVEARWQGGFVNVEPADDGAEQSA